MKTRRIVWMVGILLAYALELRAVSNAHSDSNQLRIHGDTAPSSNFRVAGYKDERCLEKIAPLTDCADNWFRTYSCDCANPSGPCGLATCSSDTLTPGGIAFIVCMVILGIFCIAGCCYCCPGCPVYKRYHPLPPESNIQGVQMRGRWKHKKKRSGANGKSKKHHQGAVAVPTPPFVLQPQMEDGEPVPVPPFQFGGPALPAGYVPVVISPPPGYGAAGAVPPAPGYLVPIASVPAPLPVPPNQVSVVVEPNKSAEELSQPEGS